MTTFAHSKRCNPSNAEAFDKWAAASEERSTTAPKAFSAPYGKPTGDDDSYPFTVVGTHHRCMDEYSEDTRYYVMDCSTGRRYYWKHPVSGEIMTWFTIQDASMVAGWLKAGEKSPSVVRV
jgi:hypothetical protein